jgi:hypothetical protein
MRPRAAAGISGLERALVERSEELALRLEAVLEQVQTRDREVYTLRRARADDGTRHALL